ncbi:hypothetical protein FO519_004507 [Halicephalobus sp. NKZ332]|nr:hypothetical protein FO519_004507 [Halicephalobus sp. NKZ332]
MDLVSLLSVLSQQSTSPTNNNSILEQFQFLNPQILQAFNQGQNPGLSPFGFGSPSKDTYCELCEKNFCNRYFLKTHKQKKHGILDGTETPAKQPRLDMSNSPVINGSNDIDEILANVVQESMSNGGNSDFFNLIKQMANGTPVKSESVTPERYNCDQCDKDFSTQGHLMQHQLSHHLASTASPVVSAGSSMNTNILNILPGGFPGLPFMLPQMTPPFVKMDMEPPGFNSLSPISSLAQSMSTKPSQKRQYSSTSKNFCDLCKKEVCNKYFLRTHMLKMHNIVIDENKTVIANIDTQEKEKEGSVTFRCDVCSLDLKSRSELREHKKDIHGIQPLITPTSAGSQFSRASSTNSKPSSTTNSATTQGSISAFEFPPVASEANSPTTIMNDFKCSKCEAEYGSMDLLIEHIKDEHPDLAQEEILDIITKASTSVSQLIKCVFCPEQFDSDLAHQVHRLKEHSIEKSLDEDSDEAMRITQEVAFKMATENQIQKLKDEALGRCLKSSKPFVCEKCSRGYSSKQRLDDHIATVHAYSLQMSPKKTNRIILSPTKVNKLMKSFSCLKCHQRFFNSNLCKMHILQHLKLERMREQEESGDVSSNASGDDHKENKNNFDEELVCSFMREECSNADHEELSRRGIPKVPEEKHSHTSGSASPLSVTVPEAYAVPMNDDRKKPYTLQSFVMREVTSEGTQKFVSELQAYLPVISSIDGPITVTFELSPSPQIDAQIKNV